MHDRIRGEVARIKMIQKLTYGDISKEIGYAENTLAQFMAGTRDSNLVASALQEWLRKKEEK